MLVSNDLAHLWRVAYSDISLPVGEVHLWRQILEQPPAQVQSSLKVLSNDEQERAELFYFNKDREHFIIAHATLRTILGRYLNTDPGRLNFRSGSFGKPYLAQESNPHDLRFNLSHSAGLALIAVARGRELGVDIERIRPEIMKDGIANRFFSPLETATLCALPDHLRTEAFFNCWTRKEAYIKARGEGLSLDPDKFDVSSAPGQPAAILGTRIDRDDISRWSMLELDVCAGYAAAIVIEGSVWQLKRWQLP